METLAHILGLITLSKDRSSGSRGLSGAQNGLLDAADDLNGRKFEDWVASRLQARGYKVQTPHEDFGIDLILHVGRDKIGVQIKHRTQGQVGPQSVRDVIGGREYHDCDRAWVVTNGFFTRGAEKQAEKSDICLVNREKLKEWEEENGM